MTRSSRVKGAVPTWGLVALLAIGLTVGVGAVGGIAAADTGEQDDEATFDYVEAEVTSTSLFGSASTVEVSYSAPEGTELTFDVAGETKTVESDGTDSTVEFNVGGWFTGESFPVDVTATAPGEVCSGEINEAHSTVSVCEDPDEATFDSATAEVTKDVWWSGEIKEVKFQFETTAGTPVEAQVGGSTDTFSADSGVTTETMKVGGWFSGEKYPADVSLSTPAETVNATIERGDGVVELVPPEPEEHFAVDIEANESVVEGETVDVEATVENTGEAEGTQDVTVAIADEEETEAVSLEPDETETIDLAWETEESDAGEYEATVESEDDSASTTVVVEETPEAFFAVDLETNSPVDEGETLTLEGTVENTGNAADTQDVTLAVAEEERTDEVSLDAGDTATLELDWETEENDAGDYEASIESANDSATEDVTVDAVDPDLQQFEAYAAGQDGYLHTGTNDNPDPIEFAECEEFEPTQDAIDEEPEYLPDPECIEVEGEIDPSDGTWEGDFDFPTTVMEEEQDTLGDLYVEASIETDEDGATGTWDADTGEIDAEFTANIDVAIYNVDEHGVPWEEVDEDIRVTDEGCHIPDVTLDPSTENSFETNSPFPADDTVSGERFDGEEAMIVSNDFPVDGAEDCGDVLGVVDLNDEINDELGTPADVGESEVAFDLQIDVDDVDPDPPELESIDLELDDDELTSGETTDATVTAEYDDGSTDDVTDDATIESDDEDVATVEDATVTAGDAGTATITAEYENESDEATLEVSEAAHFDVDIDADESVTEGETVDVEATVENTGGATDTQDVSVAIADEETTETVELAAGDSETVDLAWETEAGDAGEYEATAESEDDSASTTVVVEEAPDAAFFAVDVSTNSPIEVGETAEVVADVENTGELEGTQDVTVSLDGEETTETLTLEADESASVELEAQIDEPGTYEASAASANDSDTAELVVLEPANFDVAIDADESVTEGETVDVEATVENTGEVEDTQDVTVAIADEETTESVALDAGDSETVDLAWETEAGDAGEYVATAESEDDSASTTVVVEEAPDAAHFAVDVSTNSPIEVGETAEVVADVENTGEQEGTQDVSVSLDGEETTQTLTLEADESASVELEAQIDEPGTYEASAASANDSDTEEFVVLEPAHFDVEVSVDSPIEAGETAEVVADIENTGEVEDTQDVSVSVADEETTESVTLEGAESDAVTLEWETTADDAGTYDATAASDDDSDTAELVVLEPAHFDVEITETNEPVEEEETLEVSADIENTGEVEDTQDIVLDIDGDAVDETSLTLEGAESDSVTLEWETEADDAGEYTATVSSDDDSDSADVEVEEPLEPAFFAVDIVDTNSPVTIDEHVEVTAEIENTGDESADQIVELTFYPDEESIGDEEPPAIDSTIVSLDGGESDTVTLEEEEIPEAQEGTEFIVHVSSEDDEDWEWFEVETLEPIEFEGYAAGQEGYLHTGTDDEETDAIEYTECEDFEPTQDAIDDEPDYLPDPECIFVDGEVDPEDNTWEGDFDFPTTIMEEEDDTVGDVYVEASIETTDAGAEGTWDMETGEIHAEFAVDIEVHIYNVEEHGVPWEDVGDDIRLTDEDCHIPEVSLDSSTEDSFETNSDFPATDTVSGERFADGSAMLVSNDFPVDGAADCGDLIPGLSANELINDEMGLPADEGDSEVALDLEIDLDE